MGVSVVGIRYLDGSRLRRSVMAAAAWVEAAREELNRINVFPVPDGDTGTNFALTLRAAADGVRRLDGAALPTVAGAMATAGVFGARGNSGMLLSQFLLGFREAIGDRLAATSLELAHALRLGNRRLHESLDDPVEGTILTVSRAAADAAEEAASNTDNLVTFMHEVLARCETSLARTPDLLHVLREAGVVDAGAKAFVRLLEGIVRLIDGESVTDGIPVDSGLVPSAAAVTDVAAERDFGYCTEVLLRGGRFPPSTEIRAVLRELGGSIVVLAADGLLKVHVHTDFPERVLELAHGWGEIEATKVDDMREQHRALEGTETRRVAIVVDSTCDLPDDVIDRTGMIVVPIQVIGDGRTFEDRVELRGDDLYRRMRDSADVYSTSQPTPGALAAAFRDARAHAPEALGLFVSGALSGTLASAKQAARATELDGIHVVDSRSTSFGLGLLAVRAAELVDEGLPAAAIARELARIRDRSGALFTVDTFEHLRRSGRVSRGKAWVGGLLHMKPILEVTREGKAVAIDRVRGREALIPRVLELLDARLTPRPAKLRAAVAHAGAPELAAQLREQILERYRPTACYVNSVTAALGVHTGPGAWGIFYQVEDPSP